MKLNKYIFVLILYSLLFTLSGCRPKGILHSRGMRRVLIDLHKADALLQVHGLTQASPEDKALYYAQVLEKHGVTQAQFDSSLVWYTAHPQLFDKIYPKVLAALKAEEDAFVAEHEQALHLVPDIEDERTEEPLFTQAQLDSALWVTIHGWPSLWEPLPLFGTPPFIPTPLLVHDAEDELLP